MNYSVKTIPNFDKEIKKLAKRHTSIKSDFINFVKQIAENPELGTSLGLNCYKVRMAITSKGKGKSGGARIITHFQVINNTIFLLSIYDKSDKESITDKELANLLKFLIQ
jgi:mRNA-degrading endonuclease RelE of RelBE toxin-antitoxin system